MNIETKKETYIGMDLHKRTSTFSIKDKDGNIIDKRKIDTDRKQITEYLTPYRGASLALEPVSQWYVYADLIQGLGIEVHLAHPMKVKAIAFARVKTDSIDAGVLADLLRSNLLPEAHFSSKEVRSWKETVRFRSSLISLRAQVKNKIWSVLFKNALLPPYGNIWGTKGLMYLKDLSLEPPFDFQLKHYMELLPDIDKQIDAAEAEVLKRVSDIPETKLLTTIPGIAHISALTLMAEIGNIKRFSSAGKLMGYAGITPSTYASGDRVRHGKITKQGSVWLRTVLIEIAWRQVRSKQNHCLKEYYERLEKKKGSKTAAVATARKLCAIIWRILTDNRPFDPKRGKIGPLTNVVSSPCLEERR